MTKESDRTGLLAEQLAAQRLEACGHRVLRRRWRSGRLEVDLITETPGKLHFVEVKSSSRAGTDPLEAISSAKQRRIVRAARNYLRMYPDRREISFDAVSVVFKENGADVEYCESAFLPVF